MQLKELIKLQENGAFKDKGFCIGEKVFTTEESINFVRNLGWSHHDVEFFKAVEKTSKFISGIKKYVANPVILNDTEVLFENRRRLDTEKYVDRIVLNCKDQFSYTIISGLPGVGGRYGAYSIKNSFSIPIKSFSCLKDLGEWLNKQA